MLPPYPGLVGTDPAGQGSDLDKKQQNWLGIQSIEEEWHEEESGKWESEGK